MLISEAIGNRLRGDQRLVLAIAGPPAAGKSTLAAEVVALLQPTAALVAMDAFHLDDAVLTARGHRDRKGAPHTFDVDGYRHLMRRIRSDRDRPIAVPVFDRSMELSRAAALMVEPHHTVVVTEGNWLLLDDERWFELRELFDLTVMLTAPEETLVQRLRARWERHGYPSVAIEQKLTGNDVPNARIVAANSGPADLVLVSG